MSSRLIYTSATELLIKGQTGYGIVARHEDMPNPVWQFAETRSSIIEKNSTIAQMRVRTESDGIRVIYSHRILKQPDKNWHFLSMVRDVTDHTGRAASLADHVMIREDEVASFLPEDATIGIPWISPADVMLGLMQKTLAYGWLKEWNEHPRFFTEDEKKMDFGQFEPGGDAGIWDRLPLQAGASLTWSPDYLLEGQTSRKCRLVHDQLTAEDWLHLYNGALHALEPAAAWDTTFTTCLDLEKYSDDFIWEAMPPASDFWQHRTRRARLDLTKPPEEASPSVIAAIATAAVEAAAEPEPPPAPADDLLPPSPAKVQPDEPLPTMAGAPSVVSKDDVALEQTGARKHSFSLGLIIGAVVVLSLLGVRAFFLLFPSGEKYPGAAKTVSKSPPKASAASENTLPKAGAGTGTEPAGTQLAANNTNKLPAAPTPMANANELNTLKSTPAPVPTPNTPMTTPGVTVPASAPAANAVRFRVTRRFGKLPAVYLTNKGKWNASAPGIPITDLAMVTGTEPDAEAPIFRLIAQPPMPLTFSAAMQLHEEGKAIKPIAQMNANAAQPVTLTRMGNDPGVPWNGISMSMAGNDVFHLLLVDGTAPDSPVVQGAELQLLPAGEDGILKPADAGGVVWIADILSQCRSLGLSGATLSFQAVAAAPIHGIFYQNIFRGQQSTKWDETPAVQGFNVKAQLTECATQRTALESGQKNLSEQIEVERTRTNGSKDKLRSDYGTVINAKIKSVKDAVRDAPANAALKAALKEATDLKNKLEPKFNRSKKGPEKDTLGSELTAANKAVNDAEDAILAKAKEHDDVKKLETELTTKLADLDVKFNTTIIPNIKERFKADGLEAGLKAIHEIEAALKTPGKSILKLTVGSRPYPLITVQSVAKAAPAP